ncbi:glutathione peroxidase [Aeromonas salmonicida]|uniref:glutathione peroxidase n=1 Tax=Aeromonas salmonicida TaxID=645 RepID=UPI00111A5DC7|nr:glutathione peroxidase [Aeromonas salmonicida]TNI86884.1 glutathione peroxidase [Aeromonas salmonicida]
MKWFTLLLLLGVGTASAACPDYFNVEQRELNSTQRHNLCQLTEGKVVLVVNTASYCGYRGQFGDLETLYQTYKDKGLIVLGFPSNDFWQESGDEDKTAAVCRRDDASPLYKGLAAGEAPGWNFHKYLIGRDGKLIASYGANQNPADDPLQKEVKRALGL